MLTEITFPYDKLTDVKCLLTHCRDDPEYLKLRHLDLVRDVHTLVLLPLQDQLLGRLGNYERKMFLQYILLAEEKTGILSNLNKRTVNIVYKKEKG